MSLTPERWRSLEELYQAARERPPEQRAAYLKEACDDQELRREVESLLALASEGDTLLQQSPWAQAAEVRAGSNLGPYCIGEQIGAGGMGEVYRARDTRLGREVALKILPWNMIGDPDRRARFMREAQSASRLNHPNIVTIYDIGEFEGRVYIAMEYVAGKTLTAVIPGGGLAVADAVKYAIPVAGALAKAHTIGVIHRDLKPGNIMVTPEGMVKVLDFGLAKIVDAPLGPEDDTRTATPETQSGMLMGTPAFMSPEQAEGETADARSDIFSFGAVLYEMLTGQRAFEGKSMVATMAAVLHREPEPLPEKVPHDLERIVSRCLRKDPARRYQHADDLRIALEDLRDDLREAQQSQATKKDGLFQGGPFPWGRPGSPVGRWLTEIGLVAVVAAACAGGLVWYKGRPQLAGRVPALSQATFDAGLATSPAISADGKLLAYASDRAGPNLDIWVQQLGGGGNPIRLTRESADSWDPAFSPDGTTIVFRSEIDGGGLYEVPSLGGQMRRLAKDGRTPRFSPDGKWIAYRIGHPQWSGGGGGIYLIPATGGTSRQLQAEFFNPRNIIWAPDSRHYLFAGFLPGSNGRAGFGDWWLGTLGGKAGDAPVATGGMGAANKQGLVDLKLLAWDPQGKFIVFSALSGVSANLWKIPISISTGKVSGAVEPLTFGTTIQEMASISATGAVAFSSERRTMDVWSLRIDPHSGRVSGKPERLTSDGTVGEPSASAAGDRMVFESSRAGNRDIWFRDLRTGVETQVTAAQFPEGFPVISADGLRVAYGAVEEHKGPYIGEFSEYNIYYLSIPTSGRPAALQKLCDHCGAPFSWSPDGTTLLGLTGNPLYVQAYPIPSGKPTVLVEDPSRNIFEPRFNSDGKWILFLVHGRGWSRVYAAPYRGRSIPTSEWIPLTDGNSWEDKPRWSPDDDAIYFTSDRDGFRCIWAQRLDSQKRPAGPPFAVYHFHDARLSLMNVGPARLDISVARDRLVFNQGETTGNIWLTTLKESLAANGRK